MVQIHRRLSPFMAYTVHPEPVLRPRPLLPHKPYVRFSFHFTLQSALSAALARARTSVGGKAVVQTYLANLKLYVEPDGTLPVEHAELLRRQIACRAMQERDFAPITAAINAKDFVDLFEGIDFEHTRFAYWFWTRPIPPQEPFFYCSADKVSAWSPAQCIR